MANVSNGVQTRLSDVAVMAQSERTNIGDEYEDWGYLKLKQILDPLGIKIIRIDKRFPATAIPFSAEPNYSENKYYDYLIIEEKKGIITIWDAKTHPGPSLYHIRESADEIFNNPFQQKIKELKQNGKYKIKYGIAYDRCDKSTFNGLTTNIKNDDLKPDFVLPLNHLTAEWFEKEYYDRERYVFVEDQVDGAVKEAIEKIMPTETEELANVKVPLSYNESLQKNLVKAILQGIEQHPGKIQTMILPPGAGKTYTFRHHIIPMCKELNLTDGIFVAPQLGILSEFSTDLENEYYQEYGLRIKIYRVGDSSSNRLWEEYYQDKLNPDIDFRLILCTDNSFNYSTSKSASRAKTNVVPRMIKSFKEKSLKKNGLVVFRDELHYSGSSSAETKKENTGNYSATEAATINGLLKLKKYTNYLIAATGTPLKEQIDSDFGLDYCNIVNEFPDDESNLIKLGTKKLRRRKIIFEHKDPDYYSKTTTKDLKQEMVRVLERVDEGFYKDEQKADELITNAYKRKLMKLKDKSFGNELTQIKNKLGYKSTAMIFFQTSQKPCNINLFEDALKEYGKNEYTYAITTSKQAVIKRCVDGKTEIIEEWKGDDIIYGDETIKSELDNPNSKLRYLCVVDKAGMGWSINSIRHVVSWKSRIANYQGEPITHSGVQNMTRATRLIMPIEKILHGLGIEWSDNMATQHFIKKYYLLMHSFDVTTLYGKHDYWNRVCDRLEKEVGTTQTLEEYLFDNFNLFP